MEKLYQAIGYTFTDQSVLKEALTHRSIGSKNNERLEFLGDSILGFVIGAEVYRRFPDAREGELTRIRSSLVKGETLALIAKEFQLGQYLALGTGEKKSGGQRRKSILADALEAIIGAIYLDAGIEQTQQCLLNWYKTRLEIIVVEDSHKDPKTQLQEWLQAKKLPLPEYSVLSIEGESHEQTFKVSCKIELLDEAVEAQGSSRRRAEQAAAEIVLEKINHD